MVSQEYIYGLGVGYFRGQYFQNASFRPVPGEVLRNSDAAQLIKALLTKRPHKRSSRHPDVKIFDVENLT